MRLKDKSAIITGGGSGIGREIALAYAKEGAKVVVVGRRKKACEEVVVEIEKGGGTAMAFVCDVADKTQVNAMVEKARSSFGSVDILVGAAGILINGPVETFGEEEFDAMLHINLKGNFLLAQAVAPIMKEQNYGRIILFGSIAGRLAYAGGTAYCASKGGVIMLMKALAAELSRHGITVNCLSPGATATPMNASDRDDPNVLKLYASNTPTGRDFVPAADMVGAALFLASDEARAVNGHDLLVDDGFAAVKPVI